MICHQYFYSRRPFMFGDDSDDDEKRVVRSQKDKR